MRKNKQLGRVSASLLMVVSLLTAVVPLTAGAAPAGSGTATDPYRIATAQDFNNIRNDLSAHYKLVDTIDLSGLSNYRPIGTLAKPFSGSLTCDLDANGMPLYAIKNITLHVEKTEYAAQNVNRWEAGLFGATRDAAFTGILVLEASVSSDVVGGNSGSPVYGNYNPGMDEQGTGILIGIAENTTMNNCGVSGSVVSKSNHSGGLVGRALSSSFNRCYADVEITTTGFWCEGGFVGSALNSDMTECYATGTASFQASADSDHTSGGGFVGSLEGGMVNNCLTDIELTKKGRNFVGRLESAGVITNCLSLSSSNPVGSTEFTGASGTVSDCYLADTVTDAQSGVFGKKTAAELVSIFSAGGVWTEKNGYPALSNVRIADAAAYTPGASHPSGEEPGDEPSEPDASQPEPGQSDAIRKIISLLDRLPDDPEQVTLENKEAIMAAKEAFDGLNDAEYAEIDPKAIGKITALHEAISILMQADVVARIEALPEVDQLTYADKETVLALQKDMEFLSDTARDTISSSLIDRLQASVDAVNALSPGAVPVRSTGLNTAEIVWVVVLSVGIVVCLGLNVWMCVTIISRKRHGKQSMP